MTEKTGFAPAAAPHASTIVSTPEEAITAGETSIPSQGENMPAYHARPKSADGPLPIVIVVQEIFGVHEHIRKTLNSPKHPVDIATDLNAPVLGLYGGQDTGIPLDTVETMRHALRAANAKAEIVVYPDAGHAFNADYRPSYHAESAKDGWQRMLAWFSQYGGKKA